MLKPDDEARPAPKPGALWSAFTMKCPRCRRGKMFRDKNPYRRFSLKHIFDMYDKCPECGQQYDMEPGFWYGTSYVSYALTVAISVTTFVAWYLLVGVSVNDSRIFWWLGTNAFLLIVLQPWLMRMARVMYIRFFVGYDKDYKLTRPKEYR